MESLELQRQAWALYAQDSASLGAQQPTWYSEQLCVLGQKTARSSLSTILRHTIAFRPFGAVAR
jgi:hypothetical protein